MSKKEENKKYREGIIFAFFTSLLFGIVGVIDKLGAISSSNPLNYSVQSIFYSLFFTFLYYLLVERKNIKKDFSLINTKSLLQVIIIGCFSSGLFILLRYIGLTQSTGTFATLSQAVTTSLTIILAHFFLKERLAKLFWIMFLLILVSMYFVSVGKFGIANIMRGDLYILLGTIFLAIGNIFSTLAVKKHNPLLITLGRFSFGFIFLLLINVLVFANLNNFTFSFYTFLSGFLWAGNVIFFNYALNRIGASLTTSIIMIAPIITMILEVSFLSYHFNLIQYLSAGAVVICGLTIALKRS